ncbi:hypothetical protein NA57DRAFT_51264 [Rhizodiscina lignyota]|uniref:Uncharacterized protein n=1 Tax=Rhizodiscina lignyota TaxID=1504668 RepID=A0A9P4MB97_9PEZI|nr:hypothetical protein NA57DRAFT_51264 [Rhizodiscina lignyota]
MAKECTRIEVIPMGLIHKLLSYHAIHSGPSHIWYKPSSAGPGGALGSSPSITHAGLRVTPSNSALTDVSSSSSISPLELFCTGYPSSSPGAGLHSAAPVVGDLLFPKMLARLSVGARVEESVRSGLRRRRRKTMANAMSTPSTRAPITPPTTAPTDGASDMEEVASALLEGLLDGLLEGCDCVTGVGDVDWTDVEEDADEGDGVDRTDFEEEEEEEDETIIALLVLYGKLVTEKRPVQMMKKSPKEEESAPDEDEDEDEESGQSVREHGSTEQQPLKPLEEQT